MRFRLRLHRWRLQAAVGDAVERVDEPVEVDGVSVLDGLPQVGSHELWERWQRGKRRRAAAWADEQELGP